MGEGEGRLCRGRGGGGVSDFSSEGADVFLNTFRFFSFGYPLSFRTIPGYPKADADCGSTNVQPKQQQQKRDEAIFTAGGRAA